LSLKTPKVTRPIQDVRTPKSLMKSQIIEQLGQADLLLPTLIAEGLAANDRIKVRMSALQAAAHHAREPGRPVIDLGAECHAAGLDACAVMSLVGRAHLTTEGRIAAPDLGKLTAGVIDDARTMIRAAQAGAPPDGEAAQARLAAVTDAASLRAGDEIEGADIARLTGLSETGCDSLHRLVMDLHKVLNRLAGACAGESVAGAHVYGLASGDRPLVEAFMRGVNETRGLKFDHPGLGTTATRAGDRLVIQNDIGATDAHVVVVAVEGNAVTITTRTCIWSVPNSSWPCSRRSRPSGAGSIARTSTGSATRGSSISSPGDTRRRAPSGATPFWPRSGPDWFS
jgi:hypothetical protein